MKSSLIKSLLWLLLLACVPTHAQTPTLDLGSSQKIPIQIVIEDMGKTTRTFEIAAREALNLYPGRFEIRDNARLTLYISGSKAEHEKEPQSYDIQLYQFTSLSVSHNGVEKPYVGHFLYASSGGIVQGDVTYKAQALKETAFYVLSKFFKQLDN